MDDEQLINLFDDRKFDSRVGTEKEKGSGLGLKLVKKFSSRNNADIKVESKLGEGTTFTILFPKVM
jgi:signal transduction histidine kinase